MCQGQSCSADGCGRVSRAIVREPGNGFTGCISSHPLRHTVDVSKAREQHGRYCGILEDLGLDLTRLERDDDHPDSCFVEDTAVVHNGKALICRAAMESRRGEEVSVEEVLKSHMPVKRSMAPATIEGGDVLHLPDSLIIGITQRTNREGISQLSEWLGAKVESVADPSMMHLKSHVSYVGNGKVICTSSLANHHALASLERITVPDDEEYAANVVFVGDTVIMPSGFPRTADILKKEGLSVVVLDMSEFPKCGGAMTCLSILF